MSINQSAAEIAALALSEVCPGVQILSTKADSLKFSCTFVCSHPVHLHQIEEKMRQIVKEKRPIRTLEMVPVSAHEMLKAQGDFFDFDQEGLVELIQIGSWARPSLGPHLKNTAELAAFKLELTDGCLSGVAASSKEELKTLLKKLQNYTEPHQLGESQGFWKGEIWLAKGLKKREALIKRIQKELSYFEVSSNGPDRLAIHRSLQRPIVGEVVYKDAWNTEMHISFFKPSQNSPLQLIAKTLTILGFDHSYPEVGESEWLVEDGLGRTHSLMRLQKAGSDASVVIDVEKVLYLLLEKNLMMGVLENQ